MMRGRRDMIINFIRFYNLRVGYSNYSSQMYMQHESQNTFRQCNSNISQKKTRKKRGGRPDQNSETTNKKKGENRYKFIIIKNVIMMIIIADWVSGLALRSTRWHMFCCQDHQNKCNKKMSLPVSM